MDSPASIPPLSRASEKLIDAAVAIADDPARVRWAFLARQLVQCTLPHKNPGKVPVWVRRSGNAALVIRPAWTGQGTFVGYPYGSIPRLLLYWVVTEAKRTGKRRLELGRNLADFMREIGLNPDTGGGKRGDAKRLREQMRRLFRCSISFEISAATDASRGEAWMGMDVTSAGELWWDVKNPEQGHLWESWIELGEKFFESIMAAPVPFDMRVLRAMKGSALALDLYAMVSYRTFTAREAVFIPWRTLMQQFGAEYKRPQDFSRKVRGVVRKINTLQPELMVAALDDCLKIAPSPTLIPPRVNLQVG